jgi:hypothetical protein
MRRPLSRRDVIRCLGSSVSLGAALILLPGCPVSAEGVCADPAKMDSGAAALRASLNYTEQSPDAAKSCAACAFFTAGPGGCGSCQILSGPANSKGHCDSWGPKI